MTHCYIFRMKPTDGLGARWPALTASAGAESAPYSDSSSTATAGRVARKSLRGSDPDPGSGL